VTDDLEKARELAESYSVQTTCAYEDFDQLLSSEQIDAIYNSLPNSMHAEYAVRATGSGVHVLCEKPMAVTVHECENKIRAAEPSAVTQKQPIVVTSKPAIESKSGH
jgi:glucose-fructose oxidoreductase